VPYAVAAAERGEHGAFFSFDERLETLFNRSAGVGMSLREHARAGRVTAQQIDPAVLSPGEFIYRVRQAVEASGARIVVIDSLNGYLNAMPGERFLTIQMHELLTYLGERGVLTFLVVAQHGMLGMGVESPVDLSYLADTVLLLRYFEHAGRVRKSIAAVKTRGGGHEDSIREFRVTPQGIRVGAPLVEFQGVLGGTPTYTGASRHLATDAGRVEGTAPPAAAARVEMDGHDRGAR
jgi:circadian clock protein KaiC